VIAAKLRHLSLDISSTPGLASTPYGAQASTAYYDCANDFLYASTDFAKGASDQLLGAAQNIKACDARLKALYDAIGAA
jgi:hypothetical protein